MEPMVIGQSYDQILFFRMQKTNSDQLRVSYDVFQLKWCSYSLIGNRIGFDLLQRSKKNGPISRLVHQSFCNYSPAA